MANINLVAADTANVVESIEQLTLVASEAVTALAPVRIDATSGKFRNGNGTTSTEAAIYGLALKSVPAGMPVTALRQGVVDGLDLSGLDYFDSVYASDTDARVADAAGTVSVRIGEVIPGTAQTIGNSPDKLLRVNVRNAGVDLDDAQLTGDAVVPTGATFAVTDADKLTVGGIIVPQHLEVSIHVGAAALMVDQSFFIANRAYQVVAAKFVAAVAESTAANLRLQIVKDTGTDAPGAGTNLLTNNTNAGFNTKSTANTVQSGTLSGTASDLQLAAGDRLSLDFEAGATELVGVTVTVSLKRI